MSRLCCKGEEKEGEGAGGEGGFDYVRNADGRMGWFVEEVGELVRELEGGER